MDPIGPVVKIIEEYNCPCYLLDDELNMSGEVISRSSEHLPCEDLRKDLVEIAKNVAEDSELEVEFKEVMFNCSGCDGLIRIEYSKEFAEDMETPEAETDQAVEGAAANIETAETSETAETEDSPKTVETSEAVVTSETEEDKKEEVKKKEQPPKPDKETVLNNISRMLSKFSLFRTLSKVEIKELVGFLKLGQFKQDEIAISKGDAGKSLYIITSGKVEVVDEEGKNIAFLEKGEVFGEMSLLSGSPAAATVLVNEPTKVLSMNSRIFNNVLHKYPSLQMYLAKLITNRLAGINQERSAVLAPMMNGSFPEISMSELFQAYHLREKTGVISMMLNKTLASVSFNKGKLVNANFDQNNGTDAFYEILKERSGTFEFIPGLPPKEMDAPELGHFMCLLMEGLGKADSE